MPTKTTTRPASATPGITATPATVPAIRRGTVRWYQEKTAALEAELNRIEGASATFIRETRRQFGAMPPHTDIFVAAEKWRAAFKDEHDRCDRALKTRDALRRDLGNRTVETDERIIKLASEICDLKKAAGQQRDANDLLEQYIKDTHAALPEPWRPRKIENLASSVKDLGATWENLGSENRDLKVLSSTLESKKKLVEIELDAAQGAVEDLTEQADLLKAQLLDKRIVTWLTRGALALASGYILLHAMGVVR